jgi:hypothetical protein
VSLSSQLRSDKSEARLAVRPHWRGPELRQGRYLESRTVGKVEPRRKLAPFPSACFCASIVYMAKQTVLAKKRRGPAPTGIGVQVVVRMQPAPLSALDGWAAKQTDKPTRAEAIRRLVEFGLKVKTPAKPVSKPGRRLRAQELATKAIEKIISAA